MAVMKKVLALTPGLLALAVSMAAAQGGVNLSWNDCGNAGQQDRTSSCSGSGPVNLIVGSFVPPGGIGRLTGIEVTLDVQASGSTLPDWWRAGGAGACRSGAVVANFTYGGSSCLDYWSNAGGAMGALAAYVVGNSGPNTARIKLVGAVDQTLAAPVNAGSEYFAFNLAINNSRTSGPGACAGCSEAACVVLDSINLTQPLGDGDFALTGAATRNFVVWQGGSGGCHGALSKQSATFGQLKSLYRN